jgi:hypothetical protein
MASTRKNAESKEDRKSGEALGGGRGRAHQPKNIPRQAMPLDEVLLSLRATFAGKSSLRDSWLAWSSRESLVTYDMLDVQLRQLGLKVEDSVLQELLETFGIDVDGIEGLNHGGFVYLVTGEKNEPPTGRQKVYKEY